MSLPVGQSEYTPTDRCQGKTNRRGDRPRPHHQWWGQLCCGRTLCKRGYAFFAPAPRTNGQNQNLPPSPVCLHSAGMTILEKTNQYGHDRPEPVCANNVTQSERQLVLIWPEEERSGSPFMSPSLDLAFNGSTSERKQGGVGFGSIRGHYRQQPRGRQWKRSQIDYCRA